MKAGRCRNCGNAEADLWHRKAGPNPYHAFVAAPSDSEEGAGGHVPHDRTGDPYTVRNMEPASRTDLRSACMALLKEVHVGPGAILCPPAIEPHIRAIVDVLAALPSAVQPPDDKPVHFGGRDLCDVCGDGVWARVHSLAGIHEGGHAFTSQPEAQPPDIGGGEAAKKKAVRLRWQDMPNLDDGDEGCPLCGETRPHEHNFDTVFTDGDPPASLPSAVPDGERLTVEQVVETMHTLDTDRYTDPKLAKAVLWDLAKLLEAKS